VNRLKKEKESLDKPDIWFRPPLLKTRQLVIIGSIVVLLAVAAGVVYTAKFLVSKVGRSEGSKASIERSAETAKKEAPAVKSAPARKPVKKAVRKKP